MPLLLQLGFNYSSLVAGLLILPQAIAMLITKFFVKSILKLIGFKKALIFNTTLLGISICSFAILDKSSSYYLIIILVFLNGIFSSLQFSCMNILTYVDLKPQTLSQATSIASSVQQLSMSFGIVFSVVYFKYFSLVNRYSLAFKHSFMFVGVFTIL